jgi:hypothetical protein
MLTPGGIRETRHSLEPILFALEQIEARGTLLAFNNDHSERVLLMKVMTEIELVAWNAVRKEYELTPFGCRCLAEHRGRSCSNFTRSGAETGARS